MIIYSTSSLVFIRYLAFSLSLFSFLLLSLIFVFRFLKSDWSHVVFRIPFPLVLHSLELLFVVYCHYSC